MKKILLLLVMLALALSSAHAINKRPYMMKEDFGIAPLDQCSLQYYYFIPCPTYSWFWGFYGWSPGDVIGTVFTVGDMPTGGFDVCDSSACYQVVGLRVLDFAGYGTTYPGLFTVEFDIYCADENGCPVGSSLWNSGPIETSRDWNEIVIDPPVDVSSCFIDPGPPGSHARFLITATHTGSDCSYPEWGFDNISSIVAEGCEMHVVGCLPALYPRPENSHYPVMHSGYYGIDFTYCPPQLFQDGGDTTWDGSLYGFIELAWRVELLCQPNAIESTTWGSVKALYR